MQTKCTPCQAGHFSGDQSKRRSIWSPGIFCTYSDLRPQSCTHVGGKPQGFILMISLHVLAWICRTRVLHTSLPLLQVRLEWKGALSKPGLGLEGFYSRVNGDWRANRNFSILLRNEYGEAPVPTIIVGVTNTGRQELFHYIMRHYIALEKQPLVTHERLASAFWGILFYFLKDFKSCSSCYA